MMNTSEKFFAELCHRANAGIETTVDARAIGGALGMAPSAAEATIRLLVTTGVVEERTEHGMTTVHLTVKGAAACRPAHREPAPKRGER